MCVPLQSWPCYQARLTIRPVLGGTVPCFRPLSPPSRPVSIMSRLMITRLSSSIETSERPNPRKFVDSRSKNLVFSQYIVFYDTRVLANQRKFLGSQSEDLCFCLTLTSFTADCFEKICGSLRLSCFSISDIW